MVKIKIKKIKDMKNLFELENKYLLAKVMYYGKVPIMTDTEFDALEKYLVENGSTVTTQVGAKIKDYDFIHPTPMLSLDKIQTEENKDKTINYMTDIFVKWVMKRFAIVGNQILESSAKYDGNAINAIYVGGKLSNIVTRGDGEAGKNLTERLRNHFPETLVLRDVKQSDTDVVEIRCEVVIDRFFFDKKYGDEFANPRNYVAGVLGNDTIDEVKVSELAVMPLHLILNGEHLNMNNLSEVQKLASNIYIKNVDFSDYESTIDWYIDLRKTFRYQLDGVVFALPVEVRSQLGQNDHDPEWSIAIKFIPEEATTEYESLELNVSKTGEICPVVILKPVQLAGTTVKRASGYNMGYIVNNKIGPGAIMSIAKAGDIIPEVQSVIVGSTDDVVIPSVCPACSSETTFDGIHLMCTNDFCSGKIAKRLATGASFIGLKGIGPKTLEPFAGDFMDLVELMAWTLTIGDTDDISKYGIAYESRSHELFVQAFRNIKNITVGQVIKLMSYNNVGIKLANLVARMYNGEDVDFAGHNKSIVSMFKEESTKYDIDTKIEALKAAGVNIITPKVKVITEDSLFVCMTGSPKVHGFATKKVFTELFGERINEVSLSSKDCQYLITDNYDSTSSKMKTANKKGIEIITYTDFKSRYGNI